MPRLAAANVSGDVRGTTFFYLDGSAQDFPWVLDHQYDPAVRAKIDSLLSQYRSAGINWIRLLVATNHFPNRSDIHPVPTQALIQKVNDFMAITRAGANAGQFTIELMLIPEQSNGQFTDVAPYTRDKLWYQTWLSGLNYTNLGMVMFGGDLTPCLLQGCEFDGLTKNHADWIRGIWSWKVVNYPSINGSYEVIGVQQGSDNNYWMLLNMSWWNQTYTPTNPVLAASLYVEKPPGASWGDYANATITILNNYITYPGSKPLWIDEFGKKIGTEGYTWTAQDQSAAFAGFYGASVCSFQAQRFPKFAWVGGNDSDLPLSYGLFSAFSGSTPVARPALNDLSLYYNLQACP